MMEISDDLKNFVLREFKRIYPQALEIAQKTNIRGGYLIIPFICGNVVDSMRYDPQKKDFDELEITVGQGVPELRGMEGEFEAYFNKVKKVRIPLSPELLASIH